MRQSKLFASSSPAMDKIQVLYSLLVKEKKLFEEIATHVNDQALRCTVLSLAQQNNQYATELSSYMKCTRGRDFPDFVIESPHAEDLPSGKKEIFPDEPTILKYCRINEKKIVLAYRRLLYETFAFDGLQKLISYQLSGILAAFVQLKLLSSLKRT